MSKPTQKARLPADAQSDEKKSRLENRRQVFQQAKEDERKFEYFFASLASAAFAYSAQQYERPPSLADALAWVEPVSIGLILVAMVAALWRLSELVRASSSNAKMIAAGDDRDTMMESLRDDPEGVRDLLTGSHTPPDVTQARAVLAAKIRLESKKQMVKQLNRAQRLSSIRFYALGGGVLVLFVARLIGPVR